MMKFVYLVFGLLILGISQISVVNHLFRLIRELPQYIYCFVIVSIFQYARVSSAFLIIPDSFIIAV